MRKKTKATKNIIKLAVRLFAFMDEHPDKPQAKRVNAILELLTAIRNEKRFYQKAELLNQLQQAFRRYQWTREIMFVVPGDKQSEPARPDVFAFSAKRGPDDDDWEYGAVEILLMLAEHYPDYLSKIDRCCVCRRWMFTRKSDHRFCGGNCRQHEYDNDPERQEQHRANMRRLYAEQKERDRKDKESVRIKRR